MKTLITTLAVLASLSLPAAAHAQSCATLINTMANAWTNNHLKTTVTVMSHQANGLSAYSGAHPGGTGLPQYEARLVWNGNWMLSTIQGGSPGLMQFSDRYTTYIPAAQAQNYSVEPGQMDGVDIYLSTAYAVVYDRVWGNYMWVINPQCSNGVMFGLGDPIGLNNTGQAMWVFSFATSVQ